MLFIIVSHRALVSELFVLCAHSPIVSASSACDWGREVSTALYIRFSIYYLAWCASLRDVGRQMSRSCRQRFDLARQAMPLVRFTSVKGGERCLRHISYGTDTISGENHLRCINQNTNLEKHLFSGIFDLVQSHERNQKSVENS